MQRVDPYLAFNFQVEIDGLRIAGFRQISGLESHVEIKEYAEGGRNEYLHQLPGPRRYPKLVFSRGLTDSEVLWNWYDDASRGKIARRNLTIMLLDTERFPAIGWDVRGALPVKWIGPTFHASSAHDVAIEAIELVHKGIVRAF